VTWPEKRSTNSAKKLRTAEHSPAADHAAVEGQSGQGDVAVPIASGIPTSRIRTTKAMMATFFIS
jgi:hypothetical protein